MSVLTGCWSSLDQRDWVRFGDTVAPDVIGVWPQTRERVVGREALIRFMAAYPGDWRLAVITEHLSATGGATEIAFTLDAETVSGVTFFTIDGDGRVASFREFWPEPYDPPVGREHLLERY